MRHQKSGNRLGLNTAHKRAMVRNLVTSLLEHGQITTTLARAKEMRGELDHMIGLGKRGDLHARRQARSYVNSKAALANLFGELGERFKERAGGYSRIIQTGFRRGDGAQQAIIQLVGGENDPFAEKKAKPARSRGKAKPKAAARGARKGKTVAEQVAEEVSAAPEAGEAGEAAKPKPKRARKKKADAEQ